MATYLYSRDAKDKVRVLILTIKKHDGFYTIERKTGLLDGKLTDQPVLTISKGKVKRTLEEQTQLEFRSIVNKQKDKGYKPYQDLLLIAPEVTAVEGYEADPMNHAFIDYILPKGKTYADGSRKLMLAKDPKTVKTFKWNRDWWVSRKLDGIRAAIFYDEQGQLQAISRTGKSLNVPFKKILENKKWKTFFKKLQKDNDEETPIMIDGELYKHGMTLQDLSGASQKKDYEEERHGHLEFWIFDFADESRNAEERAILLNSLQGHFDKDSDQIRINAQIKLNEYASIKTIHDIWVGDGFEGAICRDASRLYGYGTRDDRMVKIKEFTTEEFKIVAINNDKVRPEDFTFTCELPDGRTFDVKPMGTFEDKLRWIEDSDNIISKLLTTKFFMYSPDGIPLLPVGVAIRDYE